MAPRGTVFLLSVSSGDISLPYVPLISQGLRIQGSLVASRQVMIKMLDFAARNNIKPILMRYPLTAEGITQGFKALEDGSMRYRGVLLPSNL